MKQFNDDALDDMVRTAVKDQTPDASRVLARVRQEIRPVGRRRSLTTFALSAVAAALFLVIVSGALMVRATRNSALAVDAACDHFDELIQASDKKWATSPADVDAYVRQHFPGKPEIIGALTPRGGSFEKLGSCRLLSVRFAHFVYRSNGRDISVFVRIAEPHEQPVRRIDYFDRRLRLQVAGFVTPHYEGLVVAAASSQATREIADTLAARL